MKTFKVYFFSVVVVSALTSGCSGGAIVGSAGGERSGSSGIYGTGNNSQTEKTHEGSVGADDVSDCQRKLMEVKNQIAVMTAPLAQGCRVDADCIRTHENVGNPKCPIGHFEPADSELGSYLIAAEKQNAVEEVKSIVKPLQEKRLLLERTCRLVDGGCMAKVDSTQFKVIPTCKTGIGKGICSWVMQSK